VTPATSRRDALRTVALGAGAIAAGSLLGPVAAAAQATEDEDLRDYLAEAIALEQIAALAYALAGEAKGTDARLRSVLERFRDQEQAHANAMRSAIESLGFDASDPPDSPTDSDVFDDADGIDDDKAAELADLLARLGEPKDSSAFLTLLLDLEQRQIRFYVGRAPGLDSEDLATTSAEIAANQAQHVIVLERSADTEASEALVTVEAAVSGRSGE
jgi:rubrerythrin